jgi:hypothetical protein
LAQTTVQLPEEVAGLINVVAERGCQSFIKYYQNSKSYAIQFRVSQAVESEKQGAPSRIPKTMVS